MSNNRLKANESTVNGCQHHGSALQKKLAHQGVGTQAVERAKGKNANVSEIRSAAMEFA